MIKISFNNDQASKEFILNLLDKTVNDDGIIVDKNKTPVIDVDGNEITFDQLGMIASGSEIFVKDNVVSLFKYHENYSER